MMDWYICVFLNIWFYFPLLCINIHKHCITLLTEHTVMQLRIKWILFLRHNHCSESDHRRSDLLPWILIHISYCTRNCAISFLPSSLHLQRAESYDFSVCYLHNTNCTILERDKAGNSQRFLQKHLLKVQKNGNGNSAIEIVHFPGTKCIHYTLPIKRTYKYLCKTTVISSSTMFLFKLISLFFPSFPFLLFYIFIEEAICFCVAICTVINTK